jgi:hypothetical protein
MKVDNNAVNVFYLRLTSLPEGNKIFRTTRESQHFICGAIMERVIRDEILRFV